MQQHTNSAKESNKINAQRVRWLVFQTLLIVVAFAAGLWLVYALRKIILLLALSVVFCFLIAPIVRLLERPIPHKRRLLPRPAAVLLVYIVLAVGFSLVIEFLGPRLSEQLTALIANTPEYAKRIDEQVGQLDSLPAQYRLPDSWRSAITEGLNQSLGTIFTALKEVVVRAVHLTFYIPWLILIPVIAFFWLKDGAAFQQRLVQSLPEWEWRRRATYFLSDIGDALAAYIRAQLLSCLIIGAIVMLGLSLLASPYPVVIGVLAGLLEFIPVVGPFAIILIATIFASFQSGKLALSVLVFLLVLRLAQDYIVYPRLISRGIEMHPLIVILAVLCGAELAGVIGIFLSVPVAALVIVTWRHGTSIKKGLAE